jgi:hypothetical protein
VVPARGKPFSYHTRVVTWRVKSNRSRAVFVSSLPVCRFPSLESPRVAPWVPAGEIRLTVGTLGSPLSLDSATGSALLGLLVSTNKWSYHCVWCLAKCQRQCGPLRGGPQSFCVLHACRWTESGVTSTRGENA